MAIVFNYIFKQIKHGTIIILMMSISPVSSTTNTSTDSEQWDHYRWMETESQPLNQWLIKQSNNAENLLDSLPWRESLIQRIEQINDHEQTDIRIVKVVDETTNQFYLRKNPEHLYWQLFVKKPSQREEVLIEPPVGSSITFTVPSPDGQYVAYGLSQGDSEFSILRIRHVESNTDLPETLERARYPKITWRADNDSFFYCRLPDINESSDPANLMGSEIYLHRLRRSFTIDEVVFGSHVDSVTEILPSDSLTINTSQDASWLIASISPSISGYSSSLYASRESELKGTQTQWRKIIDKDQNVEFYLLINHQLYLARKNAMSGYSISSLWLDDSEHKEQLLFEWSEGDLVSMNQSSDSLYIVYHSLGKCYFVRLALTAHQQIQTIPLPFDGEVGPIFTDITKSKILFRMQSWLVEPKIFSYRPEKGEIEETDLLIPSGLDFSSYMVEEKRVIAKDGTLIPLTIIRKSDIELNSRHPLWLTGYGAYGVSLLPFFDSNRLAWLEQGGIIAIAHVRGGGELGPGWHQAAKGVNKINSITDFIDCADYLISQGYTQSDYLVASGRSAGGILLGMATILRPELFSAIAIDMGIVNPLRLGLIPIGLMNEQEFGSTTTPQGLQQLSSIDPYVNLQKGVNYPAALLAVGLSDNRVSFWQSAKYIAKLNEINTVNPALIVAYADAGHFYDSTEMLADKISFFLWRVKYKDNGSKF